MKLTVAFAIAIAGLAIAGLSRGAAQAVDPALVGTWEMTVPNAAGAALWVWEVRANGTYNFHAEGPGNVPSHHGTFEAAKGKYVLKAANLDWQDSGVYDPPANGIVRMSGRLGTGYWTRAVAPSTEAGKAPGHSAKGIGEDGTFRSFDEAASARMKAKNQHKIDILSDMGAVTEASANHKPIVLFYSGGTNMDAILYSDAMVALAGRAWFGLVSKAEPNLNMTIAPTIHSVEFDPNVFPRVLILKPRFSVDQIATLLDLAARKGNGKSATLDEALVEFEAEHVGATSAKEYAAMIDADLRKLGY